MHAPATPADEPTPDDTPDRGAEAAGPIRLLVLDIDGTVSNSRHEIEDATVAAVARVRAAGIAVLLAKPASVIWLCDNHSCLASGSGSLSSTLQSASTSSSIPPP